MSRKSARENAFKIIFAMIKEDGSDVVESIFKEENDKEIWSGKKADEDERDYIISVCNGVENNKTMLDEEIKKYLKGWNIDRINRVCLASLRLAFYEIKYVESIPYKVSVNEGVEIVKKYADAKEAKFVNGLLGEFIKTLEN